MSFKSSAETACGSQQTGPGATPGDGAFAARGDHLLRSPGRPFRMKVEPPREFRLRLLVPDRGQRQFRLERRGTRPAALLRHRMLLTAAKI